MNPSCVPFSGEISGSTAVIMPMPTNENDDTASTTLAGPKSALAKCTSRNSRHEAEQQRPCAATP